jgi:hypothetical protein
MIRAILVIATVFSVSVSFAKDERAEQKIGAHEVVYSPVPTLVLYAARDVYKAWDEKRESTLNLLKIADEIAQQEGNPKPKYQHNKLVQFVTTPEGKLFLEFGGPGDTSDVRFQAVEAAVLQAIENYTTTQGVSPLIPGALTLSGSFGAYTTNKVRLTTSMTRGQLAILMNAIRDTIAGCGSALIPDWTAR